MNQDNKNRRNKRLTEEPQIIEQFFVTLQATFQQVKVNNPDAVPDIVSRVEGLLETTSWQNAYEIERLLIEIYDAKTLDFELGRRLVEAKATLMADAFSHYEKKITAAETDVEKKAVLNRLVNDLQWRFAMQESRRRYSRLTSRNTGITFILSILVFVAMIYWVGSKLRFFQHDDWYYLVVAIGSGLIGATFSMIVGLRKRLTESSFDELKGLYRTVYIGTRAIIGLGAALILFFFLQAEMLSGSMFPEFRSSESRTQSLSPTFDSFVKLELNDATAFHQAKIAMQRTAFLKKIERLLDADSPSLPDVLKKESSKFLIAVKKKLLPAREAALSAQLADQLWFSIDMTPLLDTKNFALLIVWSILAGFSEKFVPNLLAKTSEKAEAK